MMMMMMRINMLIMKMHKSMMMNICSMIIMMNVMMLEMSGEDADNHVDWTYDDNDGAYIN